MDRHAAEIRYVYSNRLAALAERLADDLARAPLDDALALETVVVPHPGMGRWLQQFLARRDGIATMAAFPLPAKLLWQTLVAAQSELPETTAYQRDALLWRLHDLLPALAGERGFEAVRRFLADGDDPLKPYELAARLADAFDQYVVYRPRWLERWEAGRPSGVVHAHEAWQGRLWRALREAIGEPSRAELATRLVDALERDAVPAGALPARVAVFAVGSLPPLHVDFLAALARLVPTTWYHVNPSAHWWGDIVSPRERAKLAARLAARGVAEPDRYLDDAHPLLAAWGKTGRDFLKLLYSQSVIGIADERLEVDDDPSTRLGWLRASLDALDPQLPPPAHEPWPSLRIHACPSLLREVEVLHDALLERFAAEPGLTPRDVVVMTPRLADYAPLIEAVFRSAADERRIPVTVADRALAGSHPLFRAFRMLLDLPASRLAASEVLDFVGVPAVARRLGLAPDGDPRLHDWVEALRIRWGLDGGDRADAGGYDDFTWRAGLDRLVLGYATGAVDTLVAGVAPYAEAEGQAAAAAGALARVVERLASWRTRLAAPRTAAAWQAALTKAFDELVDVELGDADEIEAQQAILRLVGDWVDAVERGGAAATPLASAVVRRALAERLDEPARALRFFGTGVTVCAMVPMRNVPFRVVCLVGLDDGEFPRREPTVGFNLMRAFPETGDRVVREDDRFLFLEALLAAGSHLHVSYVATHPRDGSARPPSPVVQELLDFVLGAYDVDDRARVRAEIVREHPAAPYDAACFAPDAPASHAVEWLPAARALAGPRGTAAPFADTDDAVAVATGPSTVALEDLYAYFRNPARDYCRRVLGVELSGDAAIDDDEPFTIGGLDRWRLDERALELVDAMPALADDELVARLRAEALLRPGPPGALDVEARVGAWRALAHAWRAATAGGAPHVLPIDRAVGPHRLVGRVGVRAGGPVRLRPSRPRGGDWVALAVDALLGGSTAARCLALDAGAPKTLVLDVEQLGAGWLERVVATFVESRSRAVPLLRGPSWDYACVAAEHGEDAGRVAARKCLVAGSDERYAEIQDPYTALLLRGRAELVDHAFVALAEALFVPIARALRPEGPGA